MRYRFGLMLSTLVVSMATLLLLPTITTGQGNATESWTTTYTPWGDPDLQGIWSSKTTTPLERPVEFEGREFLTDEDVARLEGAAVKSFTEGSGATLLEERAEVGTAIDVAGAYNSVFSSRGTTVVRTRRTSLIIDPPDGQIPYSEEGLEKLAEEMTYRRALQAADLRTVVDMAEGPEDRPNDRCLGFVIPCLGNYCAFTRIVQNPDSVTIYYEAGHTGGTYRTIPITDRPHLPSHIRQWYGDSVGHWDGDTLVVETTNIREAFIRRWNLPQHSMGRGDLSGQVTLVERFTRTGPDTLDYQFTVDDPETWTLPWSGALPMARTNGPIHEFACHEGNHGMFNMLAGARADERVATAGR